MSPTSLFHLQQVGPDLLQLLPSGGGLLSPGLGHACQGPGPPGPATGPATAPRRGPGALRPAQSSPSDRGGIAPTRTRKAGIKGIPLPAQLLPLDGKAVRPQPAPQVGHGGHGLEDQGDPRPVVPGGRGPGCGRWSRPPMPAITMTSASPGRRPSSPSHRRKVHRPLQPRRRPDGLPGPVQGTGAQGRQQSHGPGRVPRFCRSHTGR